MKTSSSVLLCFMVAFGVVWGVRYAKIGQASSPKVLDGVLTVAATGQAGNPTGFDVAAHLTNKDLATQAELIVIGECVDSTSVWVDRNLYTLATIAVTEVLKGDHASTVTVALPGGIDANRKIPVGMTYPGAPQISHQEEVFLFLMRADDEVAHSYAVMGFAQGKFSIVRGDQGNPMVARNLTGLQLQGDNKVVRDTDTLVSLSAFKEEIRSYLQQQ